MGKCAFARRNPWYLIDFGSRSFLVAPHREDTVCQRRLKIGIRPQFSEAALARHAYIRDYLTTV